MVLTLACSTGHPLDMYIHVNEYKDRNYHRYRLIDNTLNYERSEEAEEPLVLESTA